jgi:hypothetical protein
VARRRDIGAPPCGSSGKETRSGYHTIAESAPPSLKDDLFNIEQPGCTPDVKVVL